MIKTVFPINALTRLRVGECISSILCSHTSVQSAFLLSCKCPLSLILLDCLEMRFPRIPSQRSENLVEIAGRTTPVLAENRRIDR